MQIKAIYEKKHISCRPDFVILNCPENVKGKIVPVFF
jgi:hypothetical protein